MGCKIYVNTEIQVMHFAEQSAVFPVLAPSSSPSRHNDATCGDCTLMWRAGGDGGSEAPNASSKSADRKAGNLREPCLEPEQPVPDRTCVRSPGGLARAPNHAVQRARSHLCSALSALHLPQAQHKVCPLCSCFQALSSPSTAKAASGGSSASGAHSTELLRGTEGELCFPPFSFESSQAQGRIPGYLDSANTAFQKGNTK